MSSPVGFVLVLFGLPMAIWPYKLTRFEEQMDAIGSTRSWSEVEPADWKVLLNRALGVVFVVVGLLALLLG